MATGVKAGLTPSRTLGSRPDNSALDVYGIASGYATSIFLGDPVNLTSSGTLEVADSGDDYIGVFMGCSYTDSAGEVQFSKYWPASTTSSDAKGLVSAYEGRTFAAKASGTVDQVKPGLIYALDSTAGSTSTGRSGKLVEVIASSTGDTDIEGVTDLGATVSGLVDNDAFTIKTSQADTATTITVEDGDGTAELLVKLNAVDNISASLTSDGYLYVEATDGYSLVIAEDTNTPAADFGLTVGTTTPTVAAGSGDVKVVRVTDPENRVLEVTAVNHLHRDNG